MSDEKKKSTGKTITFRKGFGIVKVQETTPEELEEEKKPPTGQHRLGKGLDKK